MDNKFSEEYIFNIHLLLQKESMPNSWHNDVLIPFATGEYMVYHNNEIKQYKITLPRRCKFLLAYQKNEVCYMKYIPYGSDYSTRKTFSDYEEYYIIQMPIDLTDYFECVNYKNTVIPVALNKKGIEKKLNKQLN